MEAGRRYDAPMHTKPLALLASLTLLSAACGKQSDGGSGAAAPKPAPSATAAPDAPKSAAAAAPTMDPSKLPTGRSPMPTLAEWNGQRKEVTVKGSSALKCETKTVREYLRISCHDKNDSGGTPTTVQVTKGGKEALTFSGGGVTSLIVPYVEGTLVEATFSWTDKSFPLKLSWPKGAKMPAVLGEFAGAKSPLDGTASGDAAKLCECHKKVTGDKTCENLMGAPNVDCERTYGASCEKLLQCSRGEPGVWATCLPGMVNAWPVGICRKTCKATSDCPKGFSCADNVQSKVCEPD